MNRSTPHGASRFPVGAWLRLVALGLVAGVAVSVLTPVVAGLSKKTLALGFLSLSIFVVACVSRRSREVFLFAWVVSLTYNRQYWSFAPVVGDHGAFGPYWMVSDGLLLVLLGLWIYEAVILKRPRSAHGPRFWPWYAPFAVVAVLSIVGASRPQWAIGDMVRIIKLGVVLLYFRYNVGPREWWTIVAALGTALGLQSMLGILEVASGRTGVLWLLGLGGPEVSEQLGIQTIFGGWRRATGTVGHPPYLATFMLLTIPVFMSLALALRRGLARSTCMALSCLSLIGLACTLSRLPALLIVVQVLVLVTALVALRMVRVTRALGLGSLAILLAGFLFLALADLIYDRLTWDLEASLDTRFHEYRVAVDMLLDRPLLGVGLNNYAAHMQEYGSNMVWGITPKWHDVATQVIHMRILAGPLNGFLYVATVTGVVGLAAFLLYALGALMFGVRAVMASNGARRAACLGMVVGVVGLYLEQALDYSIWIDPVIAVWTVIVGLLSLAAMPWDTATAVEPDAQGNQPPEAGRS